MAIANRAANVWQQFEALSDRYDAAVTIQCASECAWSGELRLVLTNPPSAPSRSMTFYSVGGESPSKVAEALLADVRDWLRSPGVEPMPVPSYKRG